MHVQLQDSVQELPVHSMHTKGGHTKGATMYRHIHTHGRHASPIYKEIPKEFDSRYKTRPFDQLRFRLVDTVDGSSIRSKEAAPTSPQNQVERPSSARVEPQVISVGSSGSGSDCMRASCVVSKSGAGIMITFLPLLGGAQHTRTTSLVYLLQANRRCLHST